MGSSPRLFSELVAILRAFIDTCWSMLKWGVAISVFAGLALALVIYNRLDEEIRRQVEARLQEQYPRLHVSVRAARLVQGEGIEVRGATITDPEAPAARRLLITVDELLLRCDADPRDLLVKPPDFDQITLRGLHLHATRESDGSYSSAKLLPLPFVTEGWPLVRVENSEVVIHDPRRKPASTLRFHNLNLVLTPGDAPLDPTQPALPVVDGYRVRGTASSEYLRQLEVAGVFPYKGGQWSLTGTAHELDFSSEFLTALPQDQAERLELLAGLRASATVQFSLANHPRATPELTFDAQGRVERGRIDDPRLPFPLVDVQMAWRCRNADLELTEFAARNGDMQLSLAGKRQGHDARSPWQARLTARRLLLDRRLAESSACPAEWRSHWDRFLPTGLADVEASLSSDGHTVTAHHVSARLLNVSFTYHEFPYRLERGAGTLNYKDQRLDLAVKAFAADEEVRLDGMWNHTAAPGHGWLRCKVDNLPIDDKLLGALTPAVRETVHSLRPRGTCNVQALLEQPPPAPDGQPLPPNYHVAVSLNRCGVKYQRFAYPLDDVRGTIEVRNDIWTIGPLTGSNDTGRVDCEGHMEPTPEGNRLVLQFTGTHVPLEEELRDALADPRQRRMWDDLHPLGAINLRCQVSYLSTKPGLHLWARVHPVPGAVSVQPKWFPYRLDNVGGEIFFQDGHVDLQGLSAEHGGARVVDASGVCEFWDDGGWRVELSKLAIDRLELDRELTIALPERLRNPLRELDPQALVNVRGSVRFAAGAEASSPVTSSWKLTLDVHDGAVSPGVDLQHIFGSLQLQGDYDGRRLDARGELDFDSLTYKDLQFTNVRGPLVIDDRRIALGSPASTSQPGQPPRRLTADVCGGKLVGDCGMLLAEPRDYRLDAVMINADLKRVSHELLSGRQAMEGKVLGQIHLAGRGRGAHNLRGHGDLHLQDADVYQLPSMVRLLSVLSVHPPDRTAFTESNLQFHVDAGHVYFDAIEFKGDAISLRGRGEMDLDAMLNLKFYAVVGRDQMHLPLVGGVLRGASQQIMQIRVDGKLTDPEIRRLALPGVKKGLETLGFDLSSREQREEKAAQRAVQRSDLMPDGDRRR